MKDGIAMLPTEYLNRTPNDLLDHRARELGSRRALVGGTPLRDEEEYSLVDLVGVRDALAAELEDLGVRFGDRVAWSQDNSTALSAVALYHAVLRLGAVNVPLNPRLAGPEVVSAIEATRARVYLRTEQSASIPDGAAVATIASLEEVWARAVERVGRQPTERPPAGAEETDAVVLFSSGTTGRPKGIVHTTATATLAGAGWSDVFELDESDVFQSPFPVFAGAGLHFTWLACLWAGSTCALESYDTNRSLDRIERLRTTVYGAVPSIYAYWLRDGNLHQRDLGSLRLLDYGGAPMPVEQIRRLRAALGDVGLVQTYGLTEAGPGGTYLPARYALSRPGSIGNRTFSRHVRMRLMSLTTGQPCRPGEVGEIQLAGPTIMREYLDNPAATAEVMTADGWLRTGDAGRFDDDGFLYHIDRLKELIIRGGMNIAPVEVESALLGVPGVRDAAVIGVPHATLGEDLLAVVVAEGDLDPAELRATLVGRIADYKIPRRYEFVRDLPRSDAGKVLKRRLREMFAEPPGQV